MTYFTAYFTHPEEKYCSSQPQCRIPHRTPCSILMTVLI